MVLAESHEVPDRGHFGCGGRLTAWHQKRDEDGGTIFVGSGILPWHMHICSPWRQFRSLIDGEHRGRGRVKVLMLLCSVYLQSASNKGPPEPRLRTCSIERKRHGGSGAVSELQARRWSKSMMIICGCWARLADRARDALSRSLVRVGCLWLFTIEGVKAG